MTVQVRCHTCPGRMLASPPDKRASSAALTPGVQADEAAGKDRLRAALDAALRKGFRAASSEVVVSAAGFSDANVAAIKDEAEAAGWLVAVEDRAVIEEYEHGPGRVRTRKVLVVTMPAA